MAGVDAALSVVWTATDSTGIAALAGIVVQGTLSASEVPAQTMTDDKTAGNPAVFCCPELLESDVVQRRENPSTLLDMAGSLC